MGVVCIFGELKAVWRLGSGDVSPPCLAVSAEVTGEDFARGETRVAWSLCAQTFFFSFRIGK